MHRLIPRVIFCAAFVVARISSAHADDELAESLHAELLAMECPGAIVGIAVGDQAPQVFCLGVADVQTKSPMQRSFRMRIASVTKPFLGTAILLLVDEGKLELDDPISQFVPGVPAGDKINLRQLANNTSGIFNSIENKAFQAAIIADPQRDWPAREILAAAFAKPSYNAPGEAWRYSNTNAVLLGQVIEEVTGKPHAEFIKARILATLGLENTDFVDGPSLPSPSPSGYRNGYENKWLGYGQTFYDVTGYSAAWTGAAGNMYSTIDDLLKAAKPIATGSLLSDTSRDELHAWVETTIPDLQYGFCLGHYRGWQGHAGDVPGFASFLGYLPAHDATIVVLANLSNNKDGTSPAERLRDVVIQQMEWNGK